MKHSLLLLTALPVLSAACSEWPRSAHIPDSNSVPAPSDPGDLVTVDWSGFAETGDAPAPNPAVVSLSPGQGVVVSGTLEGSGWNDGLRSAWDSPNCDGETRSFSLGIDGNWTADVDALGLEIVEDSQLCVSVQGPDIDTGWDLVLFEVDDCVLPVSSVFDGAAPAGVALGGTEGGWTTVVEAGFYQLAFAAYEPVDPERITDYDIAIASLQSDSDAELLCPSIPAEAR